MTENVLLDEGTVRPVNRAVHYKEPTIECDVSPAYHLNVNTPRFMAQPENTSHIDATIVLYRASVDREEATIDDVEPSTLFDIQMPNVLFRLKRRIGGLINSG
ncbi:hypothetical protein OAN94_05770, partial [Verrucomicrobiales bacterium]|nr:hypothetical protein [Verrucomicrobiales bacterium]